jgi:hypothetical protein
MTFARKINWAAVAKLSSIIVFVGGVLVSLVGWTVSEVRRSAKLEAEVEYMQKYERVITENIMLRASCGEKAKAAPDTTAAPKVKTFAADPSAISKADNRKSMMRHLSEDVDTIKDQKTRIKRKEELMNLMQ